MASFRPMVKTPGDRDWVGNAQRFATAGEAEDAVQNLAMRWILVRETHVEPSEDEPNYVYVDGRAVPMRDVAAELAA